MKGETVDEYLGRTLAIANKMKLHSENVQEIMVVEKVLRSMTDRLKSPTMWKLFN